MVLSDDDKDILKRLAAGAGLRVVLRYLTGVCGEERMRESVRAVLLEARTPPRKRGGAMGRGSSDEHRFPKMKGSGFGSCRPRL